MGVESLEERMLLTTLTVNSLADNLIPDDGLVTRREAIVAANTDTPTDLGDMGGGADNIVFDASLPMGQLPIALTLGELTITEALTITGHGAPNTVIDAQQNSRILSISDSAGDVTLVGLTLTGGRTTGDNVFGDTFSGGAVHFASSGTLTIQNSVASQNSTMGDQARGGAIFANGNLVLAGSGVFQNSTEGAEASGGGIFARSGAASKPTSAPTKLQSEYSQ